MSNRLKVISAVLAALALSACVGFIVPVPLSSSSQDETSQHNRR